MRAWTPLPGALALALGLLSAGCTRDQPFSRNLEMYCTAPPPGADSEALHNYIACERDRYYYDQGIMGAGGVGIM